MEISTGFEYCIYTSFTDRRKFWTTVSLPTVWGLIYGNYWFNLDFSAERLVQYADLYTAIYGIFAKIKKRIQLANLIKFVAKFQVILQQVGKRDTFSRF